MNIMNFQRRCLVLSVGKSSIKRANNSTTSESYKAESIPSSFSSMIETEKLSSVPEEWFPYKSSTKQLEDLKNSILKFGVLEPILVRKIKDDNFQILSGYLRLKACNALDIKLIKCIITENISDETAKEIFIELHKNNIANTNAAIEKIKYQTTSKITTELPNYLL